MRHRGEPLKALQHVVDMSYGRSLEGEKRVFVDALAYRKGKDIEMRKMAKFLAGKVKEIGARSADGPAQSLRAPHRAHGRRRSARRDDRKRRRRVLEDRSDLLTEVAARRRGLESRALAAGRRGRCRFQRRTPSSLIATPPGRGGIGVVRLSGPGALAIAARLITHRRRARAAPRDADEDCRTRLPATSSITWSATYFPAPASYTGDDVVELSAHGSPVILSAIVAAAIAARARGSRSRASSRCARFSTAAST